MAAVKLPDGSVRQVSDGSTVAQLAESIGKGLFKAAVAAKVDGKVVGHLWMSVHSPEDVAGQAWIFDIEVDDAHRGQGLGRQIMLAALDKAKALGCTSIKLNVFGANDVAIRLYQSLGFRTAQMQMTKQL